jgi:hydroxymethylpyrimidine/phosphomethylpyrimidine kinase
VHVSRIARVLSIASSDSGGGAGIQADLRAFAAAGCHGSSVIVALTAQNTREVRAVHAVPAPFIDAQLSAVFDDIGVDAAKTGMLFSSPTSWPHTPCPWCSTR